MILGTASAAQNVGALGVGGYTAPPGLSSAPVTGTLINSAPSFAQALVGGDWTAYRVYVAGPLLGAAIAVGCACRGRGGDPISHAAGSSVLTPGREEENATLAQEIDARTVVPRGLEQTSTNTDSKPKTASSCR